MESMELVGMLHPLVLDTKKKLISGERRLAAAKQLGWKEVPVTIARNLDDALLALKAERDENIQRLDFSPLEAVALADRLMKLEKPAADDRKREGQKSGGRGKKKLSADSTESKTAREAKTRAARGAGMSRFTYEHTKEIIDSGDKESIAELTRGIAVNRVSIKNGKRSAPGPKIQSLLKRPSHSK